MEFEFEDHQEQVREEVRKFAENEIEPVAAEYDAEEKYPYDIVEKSAEMGLAGANIPIEYGGAGYSTLDVAIISEELFAVDPGIALSIVSASFGSDAIMGFGT
ncbi:MAG: acyl-CoA dehydrogenase family protein, partial [Halapricum sp.]